MPRSTFVLSLYAITLFCISLTPLHAKDTSLTRPSTVRESIGVNIHFTDPQPGEMDMLEAAGFGWVRMDFAWGATEKTKGVYDFSHYDTLMSELKKHHMRALLILDYGNDIYGAGGKPPYDDIGRAAFARWAVAAITHFRNRGVLWELWNEPNGDWFWPHHSADDYAKLLVTVGSAVKSAAPNELFIGPAMSGFDPNYLETCLKAGALNYWDAVSVHPYRQNEPESAYLDYNNFKTLIARYAPPGKTIPIISGEWGYSVSWGNYTDQRQGDYIVREFLSNIAYGIPLSIWYDWHDDGTDPKNAENNFGTVRYPYHSGQTPVYDPKPAYLACKTLGQILGDFHFDGTETTDGKQTDHALRFAHNHDRRWAAWTSAPQPHDITIPIPKGIYSLWNEQGQKRLSVTAGDRGLTIAVSGSPIYIEAN